MKRSVRGVITPDPFSTRAGSPHRHRSVIEPGHWLDFDPFLMMAEDFFQVPAGFPDHPHRGIETVTLVLDGELRHSDNRGGNGVLGEGDLQWMTAGGGIIHAELPHGESTVHSLQLWVNLPSEKKRVASGYQDIPHAARVVADDDRLSIRIVSGAVGGVAAPTTNQHPISYLDVTALAGRSSLPIVASYNGFVYVIEGSLRLGENGARASAGQVAWLDFPATLEDVESSLAVDVEAPSRFLVVTGRPIREPVVAYGPFVMNSREEIIQAYDDYRCGHFGGPTPAAIEAWEAAQGR